MKSEEIRGIIKMSKNPMNYLTFTSVLIGILGITLIGVGGYDSALYSSYLQSCIINRVPCPNYAEAIDQAQITLNMGLAILIMDILANSLIVIVIKTRKRPIKSTDSTLQPSRGSTKEQMRIEAIDEKQDQLTKSQKHQHYVAPVEPQFMQESALLHRSKSPRLHRSRY